MSPVGTRGLTWALCGKGSRDLMLFPDAAIRILREARWSPDAKRSFEIMSGGFHWSDECLSDVARICVESDNWSFRYVMGYRASLIRSTPRHELREPWDQLSIECPNWPGFRTERCDPSLAQELDRESKKASDDLDELDRRINAARAKGESLIIDPTIRSCERLATRTGTSNMNAT